MSWDRTYTHTIALGVDRLGAALIFNEPDITISSLCWVVRASDQLPKLLAAGLTPTVPVQGAPRTLAKLKLSRWQLALLRAIGNGLEHFWPGHCERARQGDVTTSARTLDFLSGQA